MKGKELFTQVIAAGSGLKLPCKVEVLKERLKNSEKNYSVRLYKSEEEDNFFWVVFSYDGTQLETYEYDNYNDAERDYRTIISVVRTVLACEKIA